MESWILVVAGLFGLVFGSFLNVCIYRIPREKSLAWPPSSCPHCQARIRWYDNIPLLSYLLLWGKCRSCKKRISIRYPIIEAVTGILTVLFVWRLGLTVWTFAVLPAVYALIALSAIDFEFMIIPDRFSLGLIIWGIIFAWANPNFTGLWWQKELYAVIGAAVGLLGVLAIALIGTWVFGKEAMGGGDVKLMSGVGALIGWQGVITTLVFASFLGLIYSVGLIIFKGKKRSDAIPFGPFLSAGALINLWCLITPAMLAIEL